MRPARRQPPAVRGRHVPLIGLLALLLGLLAAGPAPAAVTPATFTMTSDTGDYIGQGRSYSYATAAGDSISASGGTGVAHAAINGANGDWWYLDLAAPSGTQLTAGTTYTGATRYPFQAPSSPGLSVFGNGRGCNTLTGSFTIQDIAYGAGDVVTRLRATFEQHCEGFAPALRGTIDYGQPAPVLQIAATIDSTGTVNRKNGWATVSGTVTCSAPAQVTVAGTVTQAGRRTTAKGPFSVVVDCSPTPVAWRAVVASTTATSFGPGAATVALTASAPSGGTTVSTSAGATVQLTR